jgi:hypothetical protein
MAVVCVYDRFRKTYVLLHEVDFAINTTVSIIVLRKSSLTETYWFDVTKSHFNRGWN